MPPLATWSISHASPGSSRLNLAIAAAVFPVIFLGELPDKTMIASLALSTKARPGSVWLGAAAAFMVHVILATTVGVVAFRLFPQRVVQAAVAVMFLAGAALALREAWHEHRAAGPGTALPRATASLRGPVVTAFAVIFLAEWGDLTQILTANLAAHYHSPQSVGAGALLALWTAAALAVTGGKHLARVTNGAVIRIGTAALLTGMAAYIGWAALR